MMGHKNQPLLFSLLFTVLITLNMQEDSGFTGIIIICSKRLLS